MYSLFDFLKQVVETSFALQFVGSMVVFGVN